MPHLQNASVASDEQYGQDMWIWILLGVVAVAMVAYAFWPRKNVSDNDIRWRKGGAQASNYDGMGGPNGGGGL